MEKCKNISVVIPAYNATDSILRCIDSINRGTLKPYEIIVVDDASTDDTKQVVENTFSSDKQVRVIKNPSNRGPAHARNKGVSVANGNYILFVDSDTEANNKLLEHYNRHCDAYDAIVGIYNEVPINDTACAWYKSLFYYFMLGKPDGAVEYDQFSASCAGIKKDIFERLGGYDEWFKPGCDLENEELGYRITKAGYSMVLMPDMQVQHEFPNFPRMAKTFFIRTALWVEMFCVRRQFASVGGTKGMGVASLSLLVSAPLFIFGLFNIYFCFGALVFFAIFLKSYVPFYIFVLDKKPSQIFNMFFLSIIFTNIVALGSLWGLAKVVFRKSAIYQKFATNTTHI